MKALYFAAVFFFLIPSFAIAEPSRLDRISNVLLELRSDIEIKEGGVCIFKEDGKPFSRHVMLDCETLLGNIFLSDQNLPVNVSTKLIDDLILYGESVLKSLYAGDLLLKVEKEEDATIFAKLFLYLNKLDGLHPALGVSLKVRKFERDNYSSIAPIFDALKDEQSVSKLIKAFVDNWKEDSRAEGADFLAFYLKWYVQISEDESLPKLFERFSFSSPANILMELRTILFEYRDKVSPLTFASQVRDLPIECLEGGLVGQGNACSLLEQLPEETQDKFAKSFLQKFNNYIETSNDLSSFFNKGVLPDFVSRSGFYRSYSIQVLYPLLREKGLVNDDVLSRFGLENKVALESRVETRKDSSNILFIALFCFGLLVAVFVVFGYRYIVSRERASAAIGMSKEERAELRELKGFFGVSTLATLRDLSKSYRLKVREVHPDLGQVDTGTFLDLQNKYARVKELQERYLGEKR